MIILINIPCHLCLKKYIHYSSRWPGKEQNSNGILKDSIVHPITHNAVGSMIY